MANLICTLLITAAAVADVDSEYVDQRFAEAEEFRDVCWKDLDPMLCLTERGFTCVPKESDGKDAWYCVLKRDHGRFEAIIFYGTSDVHDRLRWRTGDD